MKTAPTKTAHKLGANQKEAARKQPARDKNFSQSRDVREDRSARQSKTGPKAGTFVHLPKAK